MKKLFFQQKSDIPVQQEFHRRRAFLRSAALVTASSALLLSGCKDYIEMVPTPTEGSLFDEPGIKLGSGDLGVLNYAYALEQLEAAFYMRVVESASFPSTMNRDEQQVLQDLRDHEVVHRDFLKAALGMNAIPDLNFDFSAVDFDSRESILNTAKTFEDLGVAAYNGAGHMLMSRDLIMIAGKIVSVEARHASVIREIIDSDPTSFAGDDIIDMNGLDRALMPMEVLSAAYPFIVERIDVSKLK
jgi:hypothetical protein